MKAIDIFMTWDVSSILMQCEDYHLFSSSSLTQPINMENSSGTFDLLNMRESVLNEIESKN